MKQIIAFDIGDKRIGVAVSDPFGEYAMPSETYFRKGRFAEDVGAVAGIAEERGAALIVCGLPLNADGTESVQTEKTRRFVEALRAATAIPVALEDERYTTREARGDLTFLGVNARKDKKKKSVDSLAAAYILEGYLNHIKQGETKMREDPNAYDDENNITELVDDDGVRHRYELLLTFQYKGEWYSAFVPAGDPSDAKEEDGEGDEVVIFHIVGEEDDEVLNEVIEDDELLDEVFAEFCSLYENSEDADEARKLDE